MKGAVRGHSPSLRHVGDKQSVPRAVHYSKTTMKDCMEQRLEYDVTKTTGNNTGPIGESILVSEYVAETAPPRRSPLA